MKRAYVDSCIWIASIEGLPAYKATINTHLQHISAQGWTFCVSDIVLFEVLLKPLQQNRNVLVRQYRELFANLSILKNFTNVFKDALFVAQTENLKALDALHVTLAVHHSCELFVTSDPHFTNLKALAPLWIDLSA